MPRRVARGHECLLWAWYRLMCVRGDDVILEVEIPADQSHSGVAYRRPFGIDRCIAPIVVALNAAGLTTVASCCGHGRAPGQIALADGRELWILTAAQAQAAEGLFSEKRAANLETT